MRPLSASVYYSLTISYFKVPGKVVNNDDVGYRASHASTHIKAYMCYKMVSISKGSVLALSSGGWFLKQLFLYGSAAWFSDLRCQCFVQITYLTMQVKRERHYKV